MAEPDLFAPPVARLLWRESLADVGGWPARGLRVLRLIYAVARDVADGRLSLHASGLVYASLLSLVPLLAFSFSVLKGLGVHNQLEPVLYNALAPLGDDAEQVTTQILSFVDNIQVRFLGAIGLGLLVYTAIAVVQRIESAFNEIWRVSLPRSMFRKFTDYVSVMLVGPLLMFSALGLTASLQSSALVQKLAAIEPLGMLIDWGGQLVPYALVVSALTFAYAFVPNTRVRAVAALIGALVSGFLWATAGTLFAVFIAGSGSYQAIYSAFAAVIVFIFWLYISWLVILVGADISFYVQHPEYLSAGPSEQPRIDSCRERECAALALMLSVGRAYYDAGAPPNRETLTTALRLPKSTIEAIIAALQMAGLIRETNADPPGYVPGVPLETTPLKAVFDAVRRPSTPWATGEVASEPIIRDIDAAIERAIGDALAGRSLKDLIGATAAVEAPATDRRDGEVRVTAHRRR